MQQNDGFFGTLYATKWYEKLSVTVNVIRAIFDGSVSAEQPSSWLKKVEPRVQANQAVANKVL
jgi:hypothetical protein